MKTAKKLLDLSPVKFNVKNMRPISDKELKEHLPLQTNATKPAWAIHFNIEDETYKKLEAKAVQLQCTVLDLALDMGLVNENKAMAWFRDQSGMPSLKDVFFNAQPPKELWKDEHYRSCRSAACLPVANWEGVVYWAKLSHHPTGFEISHPGAIWVLAPWTGMKKWFEIWKSLEPAETVPEEAGSAGTGTHSGAVQPEEFSAPVGLSEETNTANLNIDFSSISVDDGAGVSVAPTAAGASQNESAAHAPPAVTNAAGELVVDFDLGENTPAPSVAVATVVNPPPTAAAVAPTAAAVVAEPATPTMQPKKVAATSPVPTPAPVPVVAPTAAVAPPAARPVASAPPPPVVPQAHAKVNLPPPMPSAPVIKPLGATPVAPPAFMPAHMPPIPPEVAERAEIKPMAFSMPQATPALKQPVAPVYVPQGLLPTIPVDQIQVQMASATTQDELANALMACWQNYFQQILVLLFQQDHLILWWNNGRWPSSFERGEPIVLDTPSIFKIVADTAQPYHGHVVPGPVNDEFFRKVNNGNYPDHVTIVPVNAGDRVVAMLLGTCEKEVGKKIPLDRLESQAGQFAESLVKLTAPKRQAS